MTSSSPGTRRSFLRRPKVCLTHPNPGRCEPPLPEDLPPRTCSITVLQDDEEPGGDGQYFIKACCEQLRELEHVTVYVDLPGGEAEPDVNVQNCDEEDNDGYIVNPTEEGEHTITATFTWSDTGTCIDTAVVTVQEENGNGD